MLSPTAQAERASGPAFERRVKSLLHSHVEYDKDAGSQIHVQLGLDAIENPEPSTPTWMSTQDMLRKANSRPDLPTEQDSHRLLGLFLSYMGVNQHYLDTRTFVDNMAELFQSPASRVHQMKSIWFIQYLLIMAMGKLMDTDTQSGGPHPGVSYFAEAMRLLPQQYELGAHGVISVEILCLVALYLQWCDRKHDAYLYVSTTLLQDCLFFSSSCSGRQRCPFGNRLGMPSACSRAAMPSVSKGTPKPGVVDRVHAGQVSSISLQNHYGAQVNKWFARRIAASLGLPVAADDRQFATELPLTSPGFKSPDALGINVRIARATGDIMTCKLAKIANKATFDLHADSSLW